MELTYHSDAGASHSVFSTLPPACGTSSQAARRGGGGSLVIMTMRLVVSIR